MTSACRTKQPSVPEGSSAGRRKEKQARRCHHCRGKCSFLPMRCHNGTTKVPLRPYVARQEAQQQVKSVPGVPADGRFINAPNMVREAKKIATRRGSRLVYRHSATRRIHHGALRARLSGSLADRSSRQLRVVATRIRSRASSEVSRARKAGRNQQITAGAESAAIPDMARHALLPSVCSAAEPSGEIPPAAAAGAGHQTALAKNIRWRKTVTVSFVGHLLA